MAHSDNLGTIGAERLQGAEIGRIGRQDDIPRIDKHPCADIDSLLGRSRHLDTLERHSIPFGKHLAKLRHALGGPILESLRSVFFCITMSVARLISSSGKVSADGYPPAKE
jgi:hypothetical protein